MAILEGKGLTKYFGGLAAVSDVDFKVDAGEVVGLIGPNGAGKTTLFNLISATLPPTEGDIKFKGQNIVGYRPYQVCRIGVARTFQTVKTFANMPVLNNVLLGSFYGTCRKISSTDAMGEATELIDFVGLSALISTPAKDLTLANQKRLEIARALATGPEVLLLDEIMEGLNPSEVAQAMELITMIRQKGITIVMIEHVMRAIMNLCGRILVLHHGEKIVEGTPQEIATSKTVMKVYLGDKAHAGS
ncbi:Branched-chain amino acid transport ATP-binding protein LivG (TC 3.A.1.4.1) [Olavius sp. associated proteobacterium Delta 1]|nr:Branched-chain amino acid transport ATP-binding protein LivG (TC 3.A.1.4.1) [Olavius sp. associated proteobacterium Delta 1]